MALDLTRVAAAAIDAALGEEEPRHSRRSLPPLAAGAAVVMVAGVAVKSRVPKVARFAISRLVDVPSLGDMADSVRERLADHGLWHGDTEPDQDDDYEIDEDDELEDEEDSDQPRADEQEAEPSGEEDWGPSAEGSDDDADDSAGELGEEDDGDGAWLDFEPTPERRRAARNTPDLIQAMNAHRSRPPVLSRRTTGPDPAARPPEPIERDADGQRERRRDGSRSSSRSKNDSKTKA